MSANEAESYCWTLNSAAKLTDPLLLRMKRANARHDSLQHYSPSKCTDGASHDHAFIVAPRKLWHRQISADFDVCRRRLQQGGSVNCRRLWSGGASKGHRWAAALLISQWRQGSEGAMTEPRVSMQVRRCACMRSDWRSYLRAREESGIKTD